MSTRELESYDNAVVACIDIQKAIHALQQVIILHGDQAGQTTRFNDTEAAAWEAIESLAKANETIGTRILGGSG